MITHLPPFRWLDDTSDAVTATPHNPPPRPRAQTAAPGGLPRVAGRVGALAVALGIGAAVLAMPGLAAADDIIGNQNASNQDGNMATDFDASELKTAGFDAADLKEALFTVNPASLSAEASNPAAASAPAATDVLLGAPPPPFIPPPATNEGKPGMTAVGPGTAAHPNAGWLFGKGFSYDASSCPAGKSCKGGNGGLIGHGGNGYNGGDGGNAGWIGHGGRGGAVVSVPPGANTNNLKGKDGRGGKIFGRDGGQLGFVNGCPIGQTGAGNFSCKPVGSIYPQKPLGSPVVRRSLHTTGGPIPRAGSPDGTQCCRTGEKGKDGRGGKIFGRDGGQLSMGNPKYSASDG